MSNFQLNNFSQRLNPQAKMDDKVLSQETKSHLLEIVKKVQRRMQVTGVGRLRQRIKRRVGTGALFTGASGTGKTMAAEVLANALELKLYRINLSSVVDKYIGETEKNLSRLFDAAENSGAILFFDEADALFGKRTEVKDSHDRYANIEVNNLLKRIESYKGLVIIATSVQETLDNASLRRMHFIIDFPFPNVVKRRSFWKGIFSRRRF